jgi:hypothetical protein
MDVFIMFTWRDKSLIHFSTAERDFVRVDLCTSQSIEIAYEGIGFDSQTIENFLSLLCLKSKDCLAGVLL